MEGGREGGAPMYKWGNVHMSKDNSFLSGRGPTCVLMLGKGVLKVIARRRKMYICPYVLSRLG